MNDSFKRMIRKGELDPGRTIDHLQKGGQKGMNQKQKVVLICTAAAVVLMILFPPYVVMSSSQRVLKAGYGFLLDLPSYTLRNVVGRPSIPATVNVPTLGVQMFGVLIVGGLIFIALKKG